MDNEKKMLQGPNVVNLSEDNFIEVKCACGSETFTKVLKVKYYRGVLTRGQLVLAEKQLLCCTYCMQLIDLEARGKKDN